jgi:thiamine pyridinylase
MNNGVEIGTTRFQRGEGTMRLFRASAILFVLMIATITGYGTAAPSKPITLRVALYPFVPDRYAIFALLAREFQRKNEGVTLELIEVDPSKDYYDDGLLTLNADVYEIDSILLTEMVKAHKITPLGLSLADYAPEAIEAVTRNGVVYAVPHWLCGNFLFYRKGDAGVRDAATWADLIKELQRQRKAHFCGFFWAVNSWGILHHDASRSAWSTSGAICCASERRT